MYVHGRERRRKEIFAWYSNLALQMTTISVKVLHPPSRFWRQVSLILFIPLLEPKAQAWHASTSSEGLVDKVFVTMFSKIVALIH